MIRYALKCRKDHSFESWFESAAAFDRLHGAGMIECPECSDTAVEKSLMAPQVRSARTAPATPAPPPRQTVTNTPGPDLVEAIRVIREHVEKNSDYVGDRFATEARAMHEGDLPHRSIYGDVRPEDARKLIEDGVPALPLPFIPKRKTN